MMDLLKKLQKATEGSAPSTLFDDLSPIDKELNRLLVEIANETRNRRKELGYTQHDLATRLHCAQALVSQYESGEYNFSVKTLVGLCDALGLVIDLSFDSHDIPECSHYQNSSSGEILKIDSVYEAA